MLLKNDCHTFAVDGGITPKKSSSVPSDLKAMWLSMSNLRSGDKVTGFIISVCLFGLLHPLDLSPLSGVRIFFYTILIQKDLCDTFYDISAWDGC